MMFNVVSNYPDIVVTSVDNVGEVRARILIRRRPLLPFGLVLKGGRGRRAL